MAAAAARRTARATRGTKTVDADDAVSTPSTKPKPAPKASSATPTRAKSGTTRGNANTSPYFDKTKKAQPKGRPDKKAKRDDATDDDELSEPTGLTSESELSSDSGAESAFDPESDDDADEADDAMNGDDSEEEDEEATPKAGSKRKATTAADKAKDKWGRGTKKRQSGASAADAVELGSDDDVELEEGQFVAGRIYPAPKTGQVPAGQVSQNTLNFLSLLQIPENNDRDWFRAHEPAYRQAEAEWKAFVMPMQARMSEADDELPVLPPNDVIHRIYRDVRFSSDKTPYKTNFSMSASRGGKKGTWAGYHLSICPGGHSILACGKWQPNREDTAAIRQNILHDPAPFRAAIGAPAFVKLFGPAEPGKKGGKAQNVFGHSDALKVAPKGVDKTHKDIDLLKLRSIVVFHQSVGRGK
ncbi:hypothetical protein VHUM_01923 [Vanrija humicola]|uniref:Uncharacterized protein n=1 Tax=Vanrija humicola TaxID=5417 RepID=A0A7D8V0K5_VANHU|nr:hypothetical protein VHUM_01923 [Vanrija humicola]